MGTRGSYNTRQREYIRDIFRRERDRAFSAREIIERTRGKIGQATVYRLLGRLASEGVLEKDFASSAAGAVYRYAAKDCGCCFHLRCVRCGDVAHMDCSEMREVERHIENGHAFAPLKKVTVIDGFCAWCRRLA